MEDYRTVRGTATGEYEEKKSRFIAQLSFADSEEAAVAFLEQVRAANRTARHNVYAYRLRAGNRERYAGGFDDPARLVSSFAGVAPSVSSNGISIHGNAPHLLQWRLEDVEIPNPNHFADIATLGGGILSSLSSQVLGNSDFFTGAFPAEYGNAVSGVFDMKLRNGNNQKNENTLQVGIMGIDVASEGPLSKKHKASYIFNYRYSTTGLLNLEGGKMDYQDLNFKLNFPTQKAGTFSIWGTSLIDKFGSDFEKNTDKWEYMSDRSESKDKQYMAAGGIYTQKNPPAAAGGFFMFNGQMSWKGSFPTAGRGPGRRWRHARSTPAGRSRPRAGRARAQCRHTARVWREHSR